MHLSRNTVAEGKKKCIVVSTLITKFRSKLQRAGASPSEMVSFLKVLSPSASRKLLSFTTDFIRMIPILFGESLWKPQIHLVV